jgi:uncharacterized DUF497 family protein
MISDDRFEWDLAKARANKAKHGVSFDQARDVFDDPLACEVEHDLARYGEQRFVIIGRARPGLLTVAYVEVEDRVRIISARHATRRERSAYAEADR